MADKKQSDAASDDTEQSGSEGAEDTRTPEDAALESKAIDGDGNEVVPNKIEDAEIVEAPTSDSGDDARGNEGLPDDTPDGAAESDEAGDIEDLKALDGVEPGRADDDIDTSEPARSPEPDPVRTVQTETVVVERRGALVPGFFGGAIAAIGLAFAAPYVIPAKFMPKNPEIEQTLKDQNGTIADQAAEMTALRDEISALQSKLAEAAAASALSELRSESEAARETLSATTTEIGGRLETLAGDVASSGAALEDIKAQFGPVASSLTEIGTRLSEVEKRPIAEATDPASIAAVEAYGREMTQLREAIAAQMAQADELVKSSAATAEAAVKKAIEASNSAVTEAESAVKAAEAKAAAEAADAAAKAERAARAQALVDIQVALEQGEPFAETLQRLDGVDLPEALTDNAAEGVPTLLELRQAYTIVAREALAASRKEVADNSVTGRASTWIQNQLGVRSLAPSEGDGPDAVLSRAEAALADARLSDAVAELSGLPEGGQQIMADWAKHATARSQALAAADELAASLAAN